MITHVLLMMLAAMMSMVMMMRAMTRAKVWAAAKRIKR